MSPHFAAGQISVAPSLEPSAEYCEQYPWYAIRTRSNHETITALGLKGKGYEPYVPIYHVHRRRSERVVNEIEAVRAALREGLPSEPCPYLREGQRIRVTRGSLDCVEGIVLKKRINCGW